MLTIRKKLAPTWFTLPGPAPAPEFLLAPLTASGFLDVRGEIRSDDAGDYSVSGRCATNVVAECVRNWRNISSETGEPLDFSPALLADLPAKVIHQLAIEIINRAVLWESERKNSQSPSTAP